MQTTSRSTLLIRQAVTLLLGAVLAVVIWLLGYGELSWLGFASAALYGETPGWRRARRCLGRRSLS